MSKKSKKTSQKTESLSGRSEAEPMEEEAAPAADVAKSPTPPEPVVQPDKPEEVADPADTRPASRGPQCFKCQRWGHVSYTCNFSTRCVKCGSGHRASECPKSPDQPPTCANCAGVHTANYRGCPSAPKRQRRQRHRHPSRSSPKTQRAVTFMQAVCRLVARGDFLTDEQQQRVYEAMTPATAAERRASTPPTTSREPRFMPRVLRTRAAKSPDQPREKPCALPEVPKPSDQPPEEPCALVPEVPKTPEIDPETLRNPMPVHLRPRMLQYGPPSDLP